MLKAERCYQLNSHQDGDFFLLMKKYYRLTRNEDFSKVINKKHTISNSYFVVYYSENELDHLRVGLSVGKKMGNAVVRNKIKRQVRMMIDNLCDFKINGDVIVITKTNYHNNSFEENKLYLSQLLKKVKINTYSILICKE